MSRGLRVKVRPALPAGFRDFGPAEVRLRRHMLHTLQTLFELYGYEPLETPAVELLSVLTGKYGDEGDKLLFRILNSGDFLAEVPEEARTSSDRLLPYITEKALRYDLTVPMARWVAQHAGELTFPFKRYQMQPVWRADRPQRGRFREFYQCDVDIVGGEGPTALFEMVELARAVLNALDLEGAIFHLNHRGLLEHAAATIRWPKERFSDFCTLLDKADKIGWEAVEGLFQELGYELPQWLKPERGLSSTLIQEMQAIPALAEDLPVVQELLATSDAKLQVQWDPTLARGLDYYTGYIYEIRLPKSGLGSIAAGGAYASLVSDFGGPALPAIGLSFGIERLFAIIEGRLAVPTSPPPILVAWIDASPGYIQRIVRTLHEAKLAAFAYPAPRKLSRQLEYAQRRNLEWVVIAGAAEEASQTVQLRHLPRRTQTTLPLHALASACRQ
ncbi:MAG: histidine--tRNA ligase [Bacteroidia bacterium]